MDKNLRDAVIEWDTVTWSRAVDFWDVASCPCLKGGGDVLDLGSRRGGLSLMFALKGCHVECTDLADPQPLASLLHRQYGVEDKIAYRALDALELNESEKYDCICFKSVLGGVGHHDNFEAQRKMIENIYRALKPGGYLLFAENTTASAMHRYLRRHFSSWASYWRYVSLDEVDELLRPFSWTRRKTFGFLGVLGRSEKQRKVLGTADKLFDSFLPAAAKYCVSVVARK